MKRFIIATILFAGVFSAYAQDLATPTLSYSALEKKLNKSDEAINDAKDKMKANTWFSRGEIFLDIHEVNIEFVRLGMPSSEAKLYLKEANEVKTVEEDGRTTEQHIYDRITLIYENDVLIDYVETQVVHPDPLPEALEAFNETLKLDDKGKMDKKVLEQLDNLKRMAESDAIRHFTKDEYDKALGKFELILETSKAEVYDNFLDSVIIYNCALAAKNAGNHELSAKYFEQAAEINYGGSDTYYLLKNEYMELEDSTKALDALQRGFEQYPDTSLILFELVNYYLAVGNAEEGMKFLNLAIEKESSNPSIYFAKGTLYEKIGEKEKALEAYNASLEVDPEFFNSWFNIGALYFNNAVEMFDEANTKEDLDEYNAAKALADEELKRAIEPMEKAHQLNPDEKSALETLQTIYYRLQMTDEYEAVKKKLEDM
ncbi:MAG: tetratricopeptide repeat protein [Bacteroidales bacterium]|nr:tetratricopeptide repeat protein [Bacteroidales bacterium]